MFSINSLPPLSPARSSFEIDVEERDKERAKLTKKMSLLQRLRFKRKQTKSLNSTSEHLKNENCDHKKKSHSSVNLETFYRENSEITSYSSLSKSIDSLAPKKIINNFSIKN